MNEQLAEYLKERGIKNPQQKEFFRLYFIEGLSGKAAYAQVYNCSALAAVSAASRLLKNIDISERFEMAGLGIDEIVKRIKNCSNKVAAILLMRIHGLWNTNLKIDQKTEQQLHVTVIDVPKDLEDVEWLEWQRNKTEYLEWKRKDTLIELPKPPDDDSIDEFFTEDELDAEIEKAKAELDE